MALKSPAKQSKAEEGAIKKHANQDSSKRGNRAENKKKSKLRRKGTSRELIYELDFYAEISSNKVLFRTSSPETAMSIFNPSVMYPSLPYTLSQWEVFPPQVPTQIYNFPVPTVPMALVSPPMPMLPAPGVPYTDVRFAPPYSPGMPCAVDNICTPLDHIYEPVSSFAALTPITLDGDYNGLDDTGVVLEEHKSLEYYLTLPKDLFPTAKMPTLNPNPIIDEMCKIKDIIKHTSWILDLEFGVPRTAVSRPVAVYDVQLNNIHCVNSPEAVHPVFEGCNEEFRKVFLFYYDCIVSVWYRSFIFLTHDDSVKNFQNWLSVPMHAFGMCWP